MLETAAASRILAFPACLLSVSVIELVTESPDYEEIC